MQHPSRVNEAAGSPQLRRDDPFIVVVNAGSGANDTESTVSALRNTLREHGRAYELLIAERGQILHTAKRGVSLAQQQHGVVVAVGGDGTVNAVAQAAIGSGRPFAVIPQGTFNYFGRAHGIPSDVAEAVRLLVDAPVKPVQVGMVNDHVFLINASLGLYPKMLEEREHFTQQLGRRRGVALIASLKAMLQERGQLMIDVEQNGRRQSIVTPTLFIGNNALQLERLGMPEANDIAQGKLVAIAVKPVGNLAMLGLALRGALGSLGASNNISALAFKELRAMPRWSYGRKQIKVAVDGEILRLTTPLTFRAASNLLYALVPEPVRVEAATA